MLSLTNQNIAMKKIALASRFKNFENRIITEFHMNDFKPVRFQWKTLLFWLNCKFYPSNPFLLKSGGGKAYFLIAG